MLLLTSPFLQVSRRKQRDAPREGFRSTREIADETKRMDRVSSSHDPKRRDTDYTADTFTKREDNGSSAMESVKKNVPSTSAATNSGPSSSNDANDRNLSSIRSSPRNTSDDDAGTVGGPVHRTLPGSSYFWRLLNSFLLSLYCFQILLFLNLLFWILFSYRLD